MSIWKRPVSEVAVGMITDAAVIDQLILRFAAKEFFQIFNLGHELRAHIYLRSSS